jgi:cellulose synthase/poly-beta-1,6-N-acetylglucosamine synthase-like glycosyltransferase
MACTIIIFWFFLAFLLYAYVGYGIIASVISFIQSIFFKQEEVVLEWSLPQVTLIIPAFNEAEILAQKIKNTLSLDYPTELLNIICITDGSTDDSVNILQQYPQITVLHEPVRKGKMAAINRAMQFVQTPIVIFSDANTLLKKWLGIIPTKKLVALLAKKR